MAIPSLLSFLILCCLRTVNAIQFFTPAIAPAGLSETCLAVLTAEIPCSRPVSRFRYGYYYSESTLNGSCTTECERGLEAYEASIASSCADDIWEGYDDEGDAPLAYIPSVLRYQYSLTCLKESGRWCNIVAGSAATVDDPGDSPIRFTDIVANGTMADPCDMCFILSLRLQVGVPFYDGPALRSQSVYESKTSACHIQGMPITTSSLPFSMLVVSLSSHLSIISGRED